MGWGTGIDGYTTRAYTAGGHHVRVDTGGGPVSWPVQNIVLCLGLCARINTIPCTPTLCLGTPPHTVTTRTIAQYNVTPRLPVIAIYTTQYWQLQYLAKANRYHATPPGSGYEWNRVATKARVNPYIYMHIHTNICMYIWCPCHPCGFTRVALQG